MRLEQARHAEPVDVAGVDGHRPRVADEGLRREVVDLVGLRLLHRVDQRRLVGHVAHEHAGCDPAGARCARSTGRGDPADEAEDLVALVEQQLGEVGAVLAGDAGDECALAHGGPLGRDPVQRVPIVSLGTRPITRPCRSAPNVPFAELADYPARPKRVEALPLSISRSPRFGTRTVRHGQTLAPRGTDESCRLRQAVRGTRRQSGARNPDSRHENQVQCRVDHHVDGRCLGHLPGSANPCQICSRRARVAMSAVPGTSSANGTSEASNLGPKRRGTSGMATSQQRRPGRQCHGPNEPSHPS